MTPRRPLGAAIGRPLAALAGALALLAPAAGAAPGGGGAEAGGFGAFVDGATHAAASAASDGSARRDAEVSALTVPGGAIGRVELRVAAEADTGSASASSAASARDVNLLGGRIVAARIEVAVHAGAGPGGPEAGLDVASVEGLLVDGQPVAVAPGGRVDLPGVGALYLFEQARDADGTVRANGLRLLVSDPASGLAPGSQVVIGYVTARAEPDEAPAPATSGPVRRPPVATAPQAPPPRSLPSAPEEPVEPPPPPPPAPPVQSLPPASPPAAPGQRIFPVAGPASFVDDWGAPRAGTGWHQGNDIFADMGTPVVAVADGTLSLVGVNPLGGNRLWLTDDAGTSYYYAHLSGYAPVAVDGARVRAGEVLAYVGNTGDAITTPPHLHFEMHPAGGDALDPYPYLVAWQSSSDLAGGVRLPFEAPAVTGGAVLVGAVQEVDEPEPGDGLARAVQ